MRRRVILIAEVAEMAPNLGDPLVSTQVPLDMGRIALLEKDPPTAIAHFKKAAHAAHEVNQLYDRNFGAGALGTGLHGQS